MKGKVKTIVLDLTIPDCRKASDLIFRDEIEDFK